MQEEMHGDAVGLEDVELTVHGPEAEADSAPDANSSSSLSLTLSDRNASEVVCNQTYMRNVALSMKVAARFKSNRAKSLAAKHPDALKDKQKKKNKSVVSYRSIKNSQHAVFRDEQGKWYTNLFIPGTRSAATWDFVLFWMLLYTVIVMPVRVAFSSDDATEDISSMAWDVTINVLFLIDIFINFVTPYKSINGDYETRIRKIASKYTSGWFILDFLATFPWFLIGGRLALLSALAKVPRLLKFLKLLRMVKMVRAYKFHNYIKKLEPKINQGWTRIIKLVFTVLVFGHFSACMFLFFADAEDERSWIVRIERGGVAVVDLSQETQYLNALYWAFQTLTTVGYGDVTAQTESELVWAIVMMISGTAFFAWSTGTFASILRKLDEEDVELRTKLRSLNDFMGKAGLDMDIRTDIQSCLEHHWRKQSKNKKNEACDQTEFLKLLPEKLEEEVIEKMHYHTSSYCPWIGVIFAQNRFGSFLHHLYRSLRPVFYAKGWSMARSGMPVARVYIVTDGWLDVTTQTPVYDRTGYFWGKTKMAGKQRFSAIDLLRQKKRLTSSEKDDLDVEMSGESDNEKKECVAGLPLVTEEVEEKKPLHVDTMSTGWESKESNAASSPSRRIPLARSPGGREKGGLTRKLKQFYVDVSVSRPFSEGKEMVHDNMQGNLRPRVPSVNAPQWAEKTKSKRGSTPGSTTTTSSSRRIGTTDSKHVFSSYEVPKGGVLGDVGVFLEKRWHGDVLCASNVQMFSITKDHLERLVQEEDNYLNSGDTQQSLYMMCKLLAIEKMKLLDTLGFFSHQEYQHAQAQIDMPMRADMNYQMNTLAQLLMDVKSELAELRSFHQRESSNATSS